MLEKIARHKWNILALAAIWLFFECWISWAAFCEHREYTAAYQAKEEYGCVFRGPIASIARAFYRWWVHTFDRPDAYIALFTAILAWSTITLWLATKRSTNIAERALTELERPYLFILDYNWILTEEAEANGCKYGLRYHVVNGGKLPASIRAVQTALRFGNSIPPVNDEPPIHPLLTAPVIGSGEKRLVTQPFADEFDGAEPARECRGGLALIPASAFQHPRVIAKISLKYDGPITTGHVTIACWEWHPVKYAFTEYGGLNTINAHRASAACRAQR
jgi:hypothetical protein